MLQEFARSDWADENLDRFTEVLNVHLFNHHPQLTKSKKRKSKAPEPLKAPLGFQIHIVDIFLEELAKVGGDTLESEKILKVLSPFVNEMVENDDQRLLDEIQDRIFYHLMKQSDTGIDYIESRGGTLELVVSLTLSLSCDS
jgi:ribosomal RNA-processing protein 1